MTQVQNPQGRPPKNMRSLEKRAASLIFGLHLLALLALAAGLLLCALSSSNRHAVWIPWGLTSFFAVSSLAFIAVEGRQQGVWRLRPPAAYDKLTLVLDRASFEESLCTEARRAGRYRFPLTVCLLDMDDFEDLNKKNGKYYADEILQKFAKITLGHIRTSDVLGRSGRDEFFVLLSHTDLTQAEKFLFRLYLQIQERLDISFSAGITSYRPGESAQDMMRRSEEALERAKQEGQRKTRCLICKDDSRVVMNFDFGKPAE